MTPSSSGSKAEGKEKEKEKAAVEKEEKEEGDDDRAFPTFKPFKSGWWDANSTFSGNEFSSSSSRGMEASSSLTSRPAPSGSGSKERRGDPLALISNISAPLEMLNYVELGERWIFVCGEESLRAFARGKEFFDGDQSSTTSKTAGNASFTSSNNAWTPEDFTSLSPGELVLRIPSDKIQYSRWSASLGPQSYRPHWGSELVRQEVIWDEKMARKTEESGNTCDMDIPAWGWVPRANRGTYGVQVPRGGAFAHVAAGWADHEENEEDEWEEEEDGGTEKNGLGKKIERRKRLHDEFIAVHVSPCQNHLALLLSSSRLLFVPHFERLIRAEEGLWDVAVDLQLGSVRCPSVYLSYGCGESQGGGSAGRVGVVTVSVLPPSVEFCRH
jgi:hypothetical protein